MTPLVTYSIPPIIRDLMVSIKVFGKLIVEPKTLGLGILSGKISKMFRKPWSSCYPIEMFTNGFINMELDMGDEGVGGFLKMALCISVRQTNYPRAATLPRYGTGLSLKFICFSAGSLTTI
jgi:hypothetical protein